MNRKELTAILELLKPALATTNIVPVFQCFTFAEDSVAAYDDQIAIVGPCDFGTPCGIHGTTLLGLLSNSNAEDVEFDMKGTAVVMTLGKSISKLPYYEEKDFIFKEPDGKWTFKMPFTPSLFDALELCLETVSKDTTQAALLGITVQGDRMFSCDGDTVTRVQLKHGAGKNRVLMSTQFCAAVTKLWSSLSVTKGSLHFSDDWAYADFGEWSVYGRILEIADPIDFDALIKKHLKVKTEVQAIPEEFADALSRARVLADPESQKTVIEVTKGKLKMSTETHMGDIKDEIALKGHPDVKGNVNAAHLSQAIKHCDQIAFHDNCTVLEKSPDVFMLVSNMS